MKRKAVLASVAIVSLIAFGVGHSLHAQQAGMTFFVTSVGVGNGADVGGLAGADAQCQKLAQSAGAGGHTWHAYMSTQAANGQPAVNARDRIGKGPWTNAKGVVVAKDLAELHGQNNLTKQTSLSEKGESSTAAAIRRTATTRSPAHNPTARRSRPATTAPAATGPAAPRARPCSAISTGRACATTIPRKSWNSSHPSRGPDGGCSQNDLKSTGGDGLFYCFATN